MAKQHLPIPRYQHRRGRGAFGLCREESRGQRGTGKRVLGVTRVSGGFDGVAVGLAFESRSG